MAARIKSVLTRLILFSLVFWLSIPALSDTSPLTPITIQLKWKHQFQFAGFYAAIEQGFYREAGFDVTLREAGPGIDPVEEVLSGNADYGVANAELALYRLNGKPVTVLAVILQHSPVVLISLKRSGILSPQDMIGKRVMHASGVYGANTMGIMLREGIQPTQFESVPLSFDINDLISGKVDATVGYVTDQPYQLLKQKIPYNLIDPRSYGIDFYGDTLFTREARIHEKPDEVRRFKEATLAGWRYAIEHPSKIVDLLTDKYQSKKARDELLYEAEETIRLIVPELVDLGHVNPGRWIHIADTFSKLGLSKQIALDEEFIYDPNTNRYDQLLNSTLRYGGLALTLVVLLISTLAFFNRRLKCAVTERTSALTDANESLLTKTRALLEKEEALNSINQNLELMVNKRTATLNTLNQELIEEIEQRSQKELSLQLLNKAIDNSSSAVLIVDDRGEVEYANSTLLTITGTTTQELEQASLNALVGHIDLPDLNTLDFSATNDQKVQQEIRCIAKHRSEYWLKSTISPLRSNDKVTHYVIVLEDITDLKKRKDEMERMALYDPLTGLDNRILLKTHLEKVIQQATRRKIKTALLFIDIDHFKEINDSLGHEAGDVVLRTAAKRLRATVRDNDTVARISGDEFILLLEDISSYEDASRVTNKILKEFSRPIKLENSELFITASIGISLTPDDTCDAEQLMKNADLAMYKTKQKGRNSYHFFSKEMEQEVKRKGTIEKELRTAISDQQFFLLFQPKVSLRDRSIIGAEALIRWNMPGLGTRSPNEFIPVAEETGLIMPIGFWVIEEAIRAIGTLRDSGLGEITMAVNLSPRQIKDDQFVSGIKKRFAEHPEYIPHVELEITESAFIDDQSESIDQLNQLREMGFTISLDDFGTGYSSLSYLKSLPIHTIKIDQAFIQDLPHNQDSVEITNAVIAMAKNLNLCVVAEGVEKEEQYHYLMTQQCEIAQGFYFGRPMTLDEFIDRTETTAA